MSLRCLFVLLFFSFNGLSQDPEYIQYTTKDGLPSAQVYDVIQDKYGFLWFSTDFGLCRFDGYSFESFTTEDGLIANTVFNFFKDSNKEIWCTTNERTLFKIAGKEPKFIPYKWNRLIQSLVPITSPIKEVVFGKESCFITTIGTRGFIEVDTSGIVRNSLSANRTANMSFLTIAHNYEKSFVFGFEEETSIDLGGFALSSFKHNGWFWRNVSLHLPNQNVSICNLNNQLIIVKNKRKRHVSFQHEILSLGKLTDSTFWVGTRGGGYSILNVDGRILMTRLAGRSVSSVVRDHENGVWATTLNNGVFHFLFKNIDRVSFSKNGTNVVDLKADKNSLWIGLKNGVLMNYKDGAYEKTFFLNYKKPVYLSYHQKEDQMYSYCDNRVKKGILDEYYNNNFVSSIFFSSIVNRSYSNSLTVMTINENGKKLYSVPTKISGRVNDMVDFSGTVYLISKNGLYLLRDKDIIKAKGIIPRTKSGFNCVERINNELVISAKDNGVLFYNDDKVTERITQKSGLTSNFVTNIFVENDSILWVCTNAGLNRVTYRGVGDYKIQQITTKDGLIDNEVNAVAWHNDTIWVGTQTGLCFFNSKTLFQTKKPIKYYLGIKELFVNDRGHTISDEVVLSHSQNRLEFRFGAISYNENRPIIYRYRLKGIDKVWTYSKDPRALYSNLPTGEYTFKVQVKGQNETWTAQSQELRIIINPPFWSTWWFMFLMIAAGGFIFYLFFKLRILMYNGALVREVLRQFLKRLKRGKPSIIVKEGSTKVKIVSESIHYVKANGNYLEIYHVAGRTMTRMKISEFAKIVPDPIEYVQVRRSYIVRVDKVTQIGKKSLTVSGEEIQVGSTYLAELDKIQL